MTERTHPDSGRATGGIVEQLQARIADLEAQLEAKGAGGVSGPLVGQPQEMPDLSALTERGAKAWAGVDAQGLREGFTAADMATAAAQGFRDGVASASVNSDGSITPGTWAQLKLMMEESAWGGEIQLSDALANVDEFALASIAASAGSEPVEFELPPTPFKTFAPGVEIGYDLFGGADIRLGGEFVYVHINYDYRYTHNSARMVLAEQIAGILSGSLVTHPSPPEGMAGGWMPMADAPRDGTLILAAIYIHSSDGTAEWQRHAIYFDEERDCTYLDGGDDTGWEFDDYEFWTPLPPPPTTPAGNEKGE